MPHQFLAKYLNTVEHEDRTDSRIKSTSPFVDGAIKALNQYKSQHQIDGEAVKNELRVRQNERYKSKMIKQNAKNIHIIKKNL